MGKMLRSLRPLLLTSSAGGHHPLTLSVPFLIPSHVLHCRAGSNTKTAIGLGKEHTTLCLSSWGTTSTFSIRAV